jgi:putative DNA primase/helicase
MSDIFGVEDAFAAERVDYDDAPGETPEPKPAVTLASPTQRKGITVRPDVQISLDGKTFTDAGNADRLVALATPNLKFVRAWQTWLVYQNGVWVEDVKRTLVRQYALLVGKRLREEWQIVQGRVNTTRAALSAITDEEEAAALAVVLSGHKANAKLLSSALGLADSARGINSMIELAQSNPSVLIEHTELDPDPYLLNCSNGTVDLHTGKLQQHDPADLCTKQVRVAYNPFAVAPTWDKCLEEWQTDAAVRYYLQTEMGAGTIARPTQNISIHYGTGANGKSVFFDVIQWVLGEYAAVPDKSLLVKSAQEQHRTVYADLQGVRLAVAHETAATDKLNEADVKNITGGDLIKARKMRQEAFTFAPTHTMVLVTNYRPRIDGTDEGIWRRIILVPWEVTIPKEQRDPNLTGRLELEAPGILNWLIKGAVEFAKSGMLNPPQVITDASAEYRKDQDVVGSFLGDMNAVFGPRERMVTSLFVLAHESWCRDNDIDPGWHKKAVTNELKRRGCSPKSTGGQRYWSGVSLGKLTGPSTQTDTTTPPVVLPKTTEQGRKLLEQMEADMKTNNSEEMF